uniref:Kinesin-like protein n=1 Tax=Grammatophora oceanica TaxID=210454 RepID=A0A7S1Y5L1_9STRA|mmetsp:Transcript_23689/g.35077  ORF Transcript_23689/g.35077 Transcript_23689/m.35077 type:complete len:428 (+) Transcript_23689:1-1284(+)
MAAIDVFSLLSEPENQHLSVGVSLFEIYGGKLYDLLNKRKQIKCLEDARGKVCFPGLSEHPVSSPDGVMDVIEIGARNRSTGTTSKNADSSRSHAVLQLSLRKTVRQKKNIEHGRMTFIDLAGSERGADTDKANRATRLEGAEINTSLLALKEVIRALATGDSMSHIPFRGSKLTQVLKESFVGKKSRTVMVACIAPNMSNCEHTLNTLRYADRVKERNAETGALSASVAASSKISTRNVTTRASSAAAIARPLSLSPDRSVESSEKGLEEDDILDDEEEDVQVELEDGQTSNSDVDSKLLDSLLQEASSASPTPMSRPETPRAGIGSKRAVADALIATHRDVINDLLVMMKTEMDLVKQADADRETVDNFLDELETIHDQQVTLLGNLHDKLLDYQGFGEGEVQKSPQKAKLELFSDDDSFDDLRG